MAKSHYKYGGLGRRKTSVARVYMNEGSGSFTINDRSMDEYFPAREYQNAVNEPFLATKLENKFDVKVRVLGGGIAGQADAVKHGIARALVGFDGELRSALKAEGLLTRDAREIERKKYGQPKARKKFQYSKR